jgi:hypothetical protein
MSDEETAARRKMEFVQSEYWRFQNGKQRYMRCPYCVPPTESSKNMFRHNYYGNNFCCFTFAKAIKAVLDRQDEVDKAAEAARNIIKLAEMTKRQEKAHLN